MSGAGAIGLGVVWLAYQQRQAAIRQALGTFDNRNPLFDLLRPLRPGIYRCRVTNRRSELVFVREGQTAQNFSPALGVAFFRLVGAL